MIQMMDKTSQNGRIRIYVSVETDEPILIDETMKRNLDDGFALIERAFDEECFIDLVVSDAAK